MKYASDSFDGNDKCTENWEIQLNNAKAQLNDMERKVTSNEQAIEMPEEVKVTKTTDR